MSSQPSCAHRPSASGSCSSVRTLTARLAVVDASDALVPITDAIRAAIEAVSTGATKPAKASRSDAKASKSDAKASKSDAKASKSDAKASKSDAKAAKGRATNEPSERFVFEFPLFRLVASPRGERLATVHMGSRHVRLWDLEGRALGQLDIGGNGTVVPQAAAFSPDGARLATGVKELRVADGTTGAELARVEIATKAEINDVVWREDGLFVTALTPKTIVLVHVDPSSFAKRTVYEHKREPGMPGSPLLDGAIGWMAVSGEARLLCLDLATGKTVKRGPAETPEGFEPRGSPCRGVATVSPA